MHLTGCFYRRRGHCGNEELAVRENMRPGGFLPFCPFAILLTRVQLGPLESLTDVAQSLGPDPNMSQ